MLILVDITSQNNTVQDLKHNQLDVIFFHKNRNIRPQKIYDLFLKHRRISKFIAASIFLIVVFLIFSHYVIYGFPLWNQCKQMLRWLRINASRCQWKHDSYMTLAEKLKLLWYMYCLVAGIMDNCIVWETYDDYFEKLDFLFFTFL